MYFFLAKFNTKRFHIMVQEATPNAKWQEICSTNKCGNAQLIAKYFDELYQRSGIKATVEVLSASQLRKYKEEGMVA